MDSSYHAAGRKRPRAHYSGGGWCRRSGNRRALQDVRDMADQTDVVFLLDVDNTLLDNDGVEEDLRQHITEAFGVESQKRYWDIFE
jgi:hypothetical protein